MSITIKRQELEEYLKECKEFEAIEVDIYQNEDGQKLLGIIGLETGGLGAIDLDHDPIEEMTKEEIEDIP